MSDSLFLALAAVFVARILAIRVGRVLIVVNYLIDPTLILPLVLIAVNLALQLTLPDLLISLKTLLWRSRLQKS